MVASSDTSYFSKKEATGLTRRDFSRISEYRRCGRQRIRVNLNRKYLRMSFAVSKRKKTKRPHRGDGFAFD